MNTADQTPENHIRVWVLIDDRAGNKSQVLGVAHALGLPFELKSIVYNKAAALPNVVLGASFKTLTPSAREQLSAPWPDLVIAAGRRTAPVARKIKKMSGGKAFLAQVMYPGANGEADFSLIAVPGHDGLSAGPDRFEIIGAPHRVTPQALSEARGLWADKFDHLPKPHIALIVGGSTKRKTFTPEMAKKLGTQAAALAKGAEGSLLITTSRRSTPSATQALLTATKETPANVFKWGDEGDNPYMGYLALADHVIVTGDSVSMCSEACATSKPVYIFTPKALISPKHARLHTALYANGFAEPFDQVKALDDWTHAPLNAAADIADEIKKRLARSS